MMRQAIRKMDEMEKDIALKSIRWSYLFTIIVLAIWMGYCALTDGKWQPPCYILVGQNLIGFLAAQLYRRQVGDDVWKGNLLTFIIGAVTVLAAGLILLLLLIGKPA